MALNTEHSSIVQQYFTEMTQYPHLSDEEVVNLSQQIATAQQQHDIQAAQEAKHRLIEGLLTEVLPTASRYAARVKHWSLADLIGQGNYALTLAASRFNFADTSRPFGSYALTYIRGVIKQDLHKGAGVSIPNGSFYDDQIRQNLDPVLISSPLSLSRTYESKRGEYTLQDTIAAPALVLSSCQDAQQDNQQAHIQVEHLLATLSSREQQVLRLRYGLDAQDGRTLDRHEVAEVLNLPVKQVERIELTALQILRTQAGVPPVSAGTPNMQAYHQRQHEDQQARLHKAYAQLQAQGGRINRKRLVALAHVGTREAGFFLCQQEGRPYLRRSEVSVEERLEQAFAELASGGGCLSVPRLKAAAHVGTQAARTFLRSRGVPPQWGKGHRKGKRGKV